MRFPHKKLSKWVWANSTRKVQALKIKTHEGRPHSWHPSWASRDIVKNWNHETEFWWSSEKRRTCSSSLFPKFNDHLPSCLNDKTGPRFTGCRHNTIPKRKGWNWFAEGLWQPLLCLWPCSPCKVSGGTVTPGSPTSHPLRAASSPPLHIPEPKERMLQKLCTKTG